MTKRETKGAWAVTVQAAGQWHDYPCPAVHVPDLAQMIAEAIRRTVPPTQTTPRKRRPRRRAHRP